MLAGFFVRKFKLMAEEEATEYTKLSLDQKAGNSLWMMSSKRQQHGRILPLR